MGDDHVPVTGGRRPVGRRRLLARAAFWLYIGYLTLIAVGIWLQALNGGGYVGGWVLAAAISAFPTLGVIVATRHPENRIGWVLGLVGIVVISFDAEQYGRYAVITDPGSLPLVPYVVWVSHWAWFVGIAFVPTYLLLLFPDGRLPSPRWRWVAWLTGISLLVTVVLIAVQPRVLGGGVQNPFGVKAIAPLYPEVIEYIFLALAIPILLCASSLVFRFRRARGAERQQLKWLAWAVVPVTIGFGIGDYLPGWFEDFSTFIAVVALATAMGLAIFRYRLYDIDLIINRTLVYGSVTAVLALLYYGCVVIAGTFLRSATAEGGSHPLVIAGSTLAVAALFRPLRSSLQSFIDRRFYRRRYDAARTAEGFAARLRHEVELASLRRELVGVVRSTLQPAHLSLWIRDRSA